MSKPNWGRVIVGGLVAGLVLNVFEWLFHAVLWGDDWEAAMEALGAEPYTGGDVLMMVTWTFLLGIALMWVYAAIRPRYGPGPGTAIRAGLIGWVFLYLFWYLYNLPSEIFPLDLMRLSLIVGFFELPIAALAGAWMYREGETTAPLES